QKKQRKDKTGRRTREPSPPYAREVVGSARSSHKWRGITDGEENEKRKDAKDKQDQKKEGVAAGEGDGQKGSPALSVLVIALASALPFLAPWV
ncbi:hypothetical protein LY76DRAFT_589807, partial [Colletotrichum caudatum]